jgi:hypothetical protein
MWAWGAMEQPTDLYLKVGSGENWITELNNDQLRDLFSLR